MRPDFSLGHECYLGLYYTGHDYYHGHDMPKLPNAEEAYESQFVDLLRDSGWEVRREPHGPGAADLLIKKPNVEYVVELKRAPESRRDRVVPLLAEAILQGQAYPNREREQRQSLNARGRSRERNLRHDLRCRRLADIEDAGWARAILEKGPEASSSPPVRTNCRRSGCRAIPQNRPDVRVRSAKRLVLPCFAPDRSAQRRLDE